MPQVLGVLTSLALPAILHITWPSQRRLAKQLVDAGGPARCELCELWRDAGRRKRLIDLVRAEELEREAPQIIQRRLHSCVALVGTITQAHQPARAVAQVVPGLLERLRGNLGETPVG